MIADELISPPVTEQTPLGSFSGWSLILYCARCGEKNQPVHKIATSAAISAKPIREIVAKVVCSCGSKPARLQAECEWAKTVLPPRTRIDLSWLLPGADEALKTPIDGALDQEQDDQIAPPREHAPTEIQMSLF